MEMTPFEEAKGPESFTTIKQFLINVYDLTFSQTSFKLLLGFPPVTLKYVACNEAGYLSGADFTCAATLTSELL